MSVPLCVFSRLAASNRVKSGRGLCLGCYYHKSVCQPPSVFSVDLQLIIGLNQVEVCALAATTISLYVSPPLCFQ
jgi:hypothetical protein